MRARDRHRTGHLLSRRSLVGGLGGGALAALLAACGAATGERRPRAEGVGEAAPPVAAGPLVQAAAPPLLPAVPSPTTPARANRVAPGAPPSEVRQAATAPRATVVPTAALAPTRTPAPTSTPTPVPYDPARLTARLGAAQTSYAGSIPERAWNVELAAERLDGARVPPGGLFSFNQAVGPTTLKAGFRIGYGIVLSQDKPETVPSVAGGICQVATTLFQAAFWAGLPFEERHYHLYWIPRYGQPPSGRVGLDATVDDPGVDLKFVNTTPDWIRLSSWVDGGKVGFVLHGVDPGWLVEAPPPSVFDVVATDPSVVRQEDPTMPAGRELEVEHAEDGFSVTVRRLIKSDGKLLDERVFTNRYLPARTVVLVGTKGAAPRAAAKPPAPAATATPAPAVPPAASSPPAPTSVPPPTATPPDAPRRGQVPSLVGLPEAEARRLVERAGLNNTYTNYQGPGDVPRPVLESVPVGAVLSQQPAPARPPPGTTVYLAVRKA